MIDLRFYFSHNLFQVETAEETDDAAGTDNTEDYNTDEPTGGGEEESTTGIPAWDGDTDTEEATAAATTTTPITVEEIDFSQPDTRLLPSGMCWRQINDWREQNDDFDAAVKSFHESCRWSTPANETCDASGCLDAEARVQRWMGYTLIF